MTIKAAMGFTRDYPLVPVAFKNREILYMDPQRATMLSLLQETIRQNVPTITNRPPVVFIWPMGSGFFHYLDLACPGRHSWPAPGVILPLDEPLLLGALSSLDGVVIFTSLGDGTPDRSPVTWPFLIKKDCPIPLFSETTASALAEQLGDPVRIDSECCFFPIIAKKPTGQR
jgi:hypothetical protein